MSTPSEEIARWRALRLAAMIAGFVFIGIFDSNVALPNIAATLRVGPASLQLIPGAYIVAFGLTLVPFGRLGDRGLRRRLIIVGLSTYIGFSVVCAFAPTWWLLIAGRVGLGVAAGMLMPQAIGVIQQLFTGAERGKAFGVYGVTTAVSTAAAPSIGGLLVTVGGPLEGWRWIFLLNVPFGVALLLACARWMPIDEPTHTTHQGLDLVGTALLGAAIVLTLAPLVFTTGGRGDDPRRWWALVPAIAIVAAFRSWERRYAARGGAPLVDAELLRTPSYRYAMVVGMIAVAWSPGMTLALMLYLQVALGLSPVLAALVALPSAAGSAFGARWGAQRVLVLGRSVTLAGFLVCGVAVTGLVIVTRELPTGISPWIVAVLAFANGLGGGLTLSPNHVLLLSDVPPAKGSLAASIGHLSQRVGNSIGIAATAAAFYAVVYRAHGALIGAGKHTYDVAFALAAAVSGCLIILGIAVSLADLLRMRRATAAHHRPAVVTTSHGLISIAAASGSTE